MIGNRHEANPFISDLGFKPLTGLRRAVGQSFFIKLMLCLFLLSSCVEQAPPPEPPSIPTPASGELIFVGIESSLAALEPILANSTGGPDALEHFVFVSGARQDLLDQVETGELDGAFVYQKPAALTLWTVPIGLDSLTIVAHPNVGVAGLTRPQFQQLFTAGLKDWSAVGGSAAAVQIMLLDPHSGPHALLNDRILENGSAAPEAMVIPHPTDLQERVAQTAGSLGYLPTSLFDPTLGTRPLTVDGLLAQSNTVQSQQYPLSMPVYLAVTAEPQGELRRLVAWLQSAEGEEHLTEKFVLLPE